jgi:Cof subfamily protein (haloacid dehalogenase superfamily)
MNLARSARFKCSAVISDVDGTLVTSRDKRLTERATAAVTALREHGIIFTIISSRPPDGLRSLGGPLGITTPMGCFNGGALVGPDLNVIAEHLLLPEVARRAVAMLGNCGVQAWVFSGQDWLVRDLNAPYVRHEELTLGFVPKKIDDFGRALDTAAKIVGVSDDFALLARCETEGRALLAGQASVARSQQYYLDITDPLANKGAALSQIATLLGVPLAEIAVIGDGGNDVAMFKLGGLSIAMGNASAEVQAQADCVTESCDNEGFANAIERYILRRAGSAITRVS